jgi:t-SNARE complex subunit (syntaxin)
MMADEITVTGSVNLIEVVSTLNHVVQEMARLGDVVAEEGRDTRQRFDSLKNEVTQCKTDLTQKISDLDKAQALTDKEVKKQIAKVSGIVSGVIGIALWILKPMLLAMVAAL